MISSTFVFTLIMADNGLQLVDEGWRFLPISTGSSVDSLHNLHSLILSVLLTAQIMVDCIVSAFVHIALDATALWVGTV